MYASSDNELKQFMSDFLVQSAPFMKFWQKKLKNDNDEMQQN